MTQPNRKLSNVKVGDTLYALDIGPCTVVSVYLDADDPKDEYICLKATDKTDAAGLAIFRDCDADGRYCTEDITPMVYLSQPLIIDRLGPIASLFIGESDAD